MKFFLFAIYIFGECKDVFADFPEDAAALPQVTFLDPGTIVDYQPQQRRGFFKNDMRIYCYRGSSKDLTHFFETVELQLEIESDEFIQYEGSTPTEVRQHFNERQSLFSFNIFTHKRTKLHLSPFNQQCVGVDTELSYRVRLHQSRVDYFSFIQFVLGVSVFLFAGKLSHNSMFYYLTGVILGICCSFMLLIWLCSKLMPRRPMMLGMMIGGWTLGVYIIQRLWENIHIIFQMYRTYLVWYILITGLLAFFFCYRIGPPKNQRSKNVIKWVLQIMAIILIYYSSQYEEASATTAIITFVIHYFPYSILYKLRMIYRRFFPKQRRLLTNDEYYEQGIVETAKALNELRSYASSPDCKQWKIISKLSDPQRFASFVEGESHLRETEMAEFNSFRQAIETEESDISEDGDEIRMENEKSSILHNSHFSNEQNELDPYQRIVSNVTYEEMSDEENNSEGHDVTKRVNIGAMTNHGTYNTRVKIEQNVSNPCINKAKNLYVRNNQQSQKSQHTLLCPMPKFASKNCSAENNKSNSAYLYKRSYYNSSSEGDD